MHSFWLELKVLIIYLFVVAINYTCTMQGNPGPNGTVLPHPFNGKFYNYWDFKVPVLKSSSSEDIVLTLPPSLHSRDMKWISVWCRKFAIDFGHVVVRGNQLTEGKLCRDHWEVTLKYFMS